MKLFSLNAHSASAPQVILSAITCIIYANVLLNGFMIDDEFVYSDNHFIRDLRNLPLLFDASYFRYSNEASYRPLCTFTYFLDAALWQNWKSWSHLINLALYVATVAVLFSFFRRLTGDNLAAFLGAGLFALHPIHTEVVNNVSFREDLLVGLFLPSSWLLYKRAEKHRDGYGCCWLGHFIFSRRSPRSTPLFSRFCLHCFCLHCLNGGKRTGISRRP